VSQAKWEKDQLARAEQRQKEAQSQEDVGSFVFSLLLD
jgi:hypothetical protein